MCSMLAAMCRHASLLTLPLLVSLACATQISTTAPSEPDPSAEPAPVEPTEAEDEDEVDAAEEPEDAEADEFGSMSDEELAAWEAEREAQTGSYHETSMGFGSRGQKVPTVRQATATVDGPLDKDIVRRIVRAHMNEVRSCYNAGLSNDPTVAGTVAIEFTIAADGFVSTSKVAESDLSDAKVGECIAKMVKRWQFPKPTGGGAVRVLYPFLLNPG